MKKTVEIRVNPADRDNNALIASRAFQKAGFVPSRSGYHIEKRSIDARGRQIWYVFQVQVWDDPADAPAVAVAPVLRTVHQAETVHIVGAGPAGYFAALELIRQGLRPVVFERGKDVRSRRRDLRAIQQFGVVNPDSNYCFGEGGAGTYSDGKLYTRSTKRGDVGAVLRTLVDHGADPGILIDAHPHIGSNKLPRIISAMRETIEEHGGEIRFDSRVTDLGFADGEVKSLTVNEKEEHPCDALILATGHSARDIYTLLHTKGIQLDFKPFAVGVRIEHPQSLIDRIQYNCEDRGPYLPAAAYRLACQVGDRAVFSFCMCPGGLIVPAATAPGEIVLNGMSLSRRDSPFANAGTVVSVDEQLIREVMVVEKVGAMDGIDFQAKIERACFTAGDGTQQAPAQRLIDFLDDRISTDLPDSSYIPGLFPARIADLLPAPVSVALKEGIREFGKRMKGYLTNDAVVAATESRTSSPVRIPRDAKTLMYPSIAGFFPCGEGAGYAGGIVSAAIDGCNVAQASAQYIKAYHRTTV